MDAYTVNLHSQYSHASAEENTCSLSQPLAICFTNATRDSNLHVYSETGINKR
jgi:hypothetical protein